jgi:hypothetical protein
VSKMGDNGAKPSGTELEKEPPFPLTEVDRWVLSQTDEEFHLHDWEELRGILGGCKIYLLVFIRIVGSANRTLSFAAVRSWTIKSSASITRSALDVFHVIEALFQMILFSRYPLHGILANASLLT